MSSFIIALIILVGSTTLLMRQLRVQERRRTILANPAGHTKADLIEVLGQPTSISLMARGRTLLQWQQPGKHWAMAFRDDVCEGVTHQYDAKGLRV